MTSIEGAVDDFLQDRGTNVTLETKSQFRLAMTAALQRGFAAWPQLQSPQTSAALLSAMWTVHETSTDPVCEMARLHIEDLTLAQSCYLSVPEAIHHFLSVHSMQVAQSLAKLGMPQHTIDDVKQDVLAKLLTVAPRKIGSYSGRAELRSWLKTVATRDAMSFLRKRGETATDDNVLHAMRERGVHDNSHRVVATYYASEFKEAFEAAMASLAVDERLLLRQFYVDALSLEQIGVMMGAHKATVFRRLEAARKSLAQAIAQTFRKTVPASPSELQSIVRDLQSHVMLSLSRLTRFD